MELAQGNDTAAAEESAVHGVPRLGFWFAQGFRAAALRSPRVAQAVPARWHPLVMLVLVSAVFLAIGRLEFAGPAAFNLRVWLASWWTLALTALVAWSLRPASDHEGQAMARWLLVWLPAGIPVSAAGVLVTGLGTGTGVFDSPWVSWSVYLGFFAWAAAAWFLCARIVLPVRRAWVLTAVYLAVHLFADWQFPNGVWYSTAPREPQDNGPRLELSQETFERQQAVWNAAMQALAPQRAGVADVYGIVFAPYAGENVFLRESALAEGVLAARFDAQGRVLRMLNNAATTASVPWATPANLERAIEAVAARMDREQDVLVVYMTSHGARDFRLAASHWPLQVGEVTPQLLRAALDKAGIRNRVIGISACYSGGWIEPLAGDTTLVMTAADATHTSYGCGSRSDLTFFGRALWDEQLRATRSFEDAFAAAVPVIKKREEDAGKDDGFSNPQIRVGEQIRPVLRALEKRLDGG